MADSSYILFNKSPLQLRNLGARGNRAYGRNLRKCSARGGRGIEIASKPLVPVLLSPRFPG